MTVQQPCCDRRNGNGCTQDQINKDIRFARKELHHTGKDGSQVEGQGGDHDQAQGRPVIHKCCPDVLTSLGTDVRDGIYLARTKVTGSGGDGIVVVRPKDEVPPAPLYVKYIPKREEYRVHVAFGKVIFAQQKRRVIEREQTKDEKLIRNHANGWVFCPVDVESLTEDMKDVALAACASLGLDFGALDIIVGRDDGLAYCLECNSAPGLSSPGLIEAYSKAFTEEMNRGSDGS